MPRLSLWNQRKQNDYRFFDRNIREQFLVGGTAFLVHKYEGVPEDVANNTDGENLSTGFGSTTIQDVLLLENRDRKYSDDVYELRGVYNVQDNDFDLSQFGLFLSADTLYIVFHINHMIDIMGRKLMSGDVLEVPHLRDDTLLDGEDDGINTAGVARKFYVVNEATRAAEGFSPTWYPHIWRVKVSPITDSQEFADILDRDVGTFDDPNGTGEETGETLRDMISTYNTDIALNDQVVAEAERQVPNRNLEHAHLYVDDNNELGTPFMYMTDGEPPNGAKLLGCGGAFPMDPADGSYFLRTDYEPSVLFKRQGSAWIRKEVDWKQKLTTAGRILNTFINNRNKVASNDGLIDSKTSVSKALAPRKRPINPDFPRDK